MSSIAIFIFMFVRSLFVDYRNARTRAGTKRASIIRRILRNRLANRIERRRSAMIYAFIDEDVARQERAINGIGRLIRALRS